MSKGPWKKKRPPKEDVIREWFSWINGTNAEELRKSFEKWLADHGLQIEEMK